MPMILGGLHGIRAVETASFEVLVSPPSPGSAGRTIGCCNCLSKIPSRTGAQVEAFVDISSATAFSARGMRCTGSVYSHGCRGARAATNASGSSHPGAESDHPLSLLLSARGVRGSSYGVYIHHVGEAGTPKMRKVPLPDALNVEVVLRHFHRHCYESTPMWLFCWRGLMSLGC
jgi:hypothetical protein